MNPDRRNKKAQLRIIYFFLFLISSVPFFLRLNEGTAQESVQNNDYEQYNPKLSYLNSTKKLVSYIDSLYSGSQSSGFDTVEYVKLTTKVVKQRFFHGLAKCKFSDNWIAYTLGKVLWSHIGVVVSPDEILKHSEGLCSQQTIVFMEALKSKGIEVRSVGLGYKEGPGHFLCEVKYNGSWHLHDVTLEPEWKKLVKHHASLNYYLENKDSLYIVYEKRLAKKHYYKLMERVEYGKVNEFPAENMLIFHRFTLMATYLIPILFFILFCSHSYRLFMEKYENTTFEEK